MISDVIASRPSGTESSNKPIGMKGLDDTPKTSFAEFTNDKTLEDKQKVMSTKSSGKSDFNDDSEHDNTVTEVSTNKAALITAEGDSSQSDHQGSEDSITQLDLDRMGQVIGLNYAQSSLHGTISRNPQYFSAMQYSATLGQNSTVNPDTSFTDIDPATLTLGRVISEWPKLHGQGAQAQDIPRFMPVAGLSSDLSPRAVGPLTVAVNGGINSAEVNLSAIIQVKNSSSVSQNTAVSNGIASSDIASHLMSSSTINSGVMNTTPIATNGNFTIKGADMASQSLSNNQFFNNTLNASVLGKMADSSTVDVVDANSQLFSQLLTRGAPNSSVSQWGPVPVNMAGSLTQQAQDMLTPLREQLRFQIDQHVKHAEIRLDPPELGKLELNIRLDGDKLHVQMHAANPAIRDALLSGLERLRADLAQEYGGTLDVDVSQGDSEQPQHREQRHETSIAMNHVEENATFNNNLNSAQKSQLNLLA
ncbi:flagellar hook-length control protein FliK [Shewanella frigidimarina]|uniref:Flagellar hook-length control protein-like C-terminal domain-containing protein n=1 Tax=Shewanella frigidimarina TaxID=56812 RepID=A0A106BWB7_SHEFR|nr:flagellar hook-length control protein FliK [Shewanella frigidimarina]KVW99820.1 hypothetical protein AWJ07_10970 [Shewanella frigidimarina]